MMARSTLAASAEVEAMSTSASALVGGATPASFVVGMATSFVLLGWFAIDVFHRPAVDVLEHRLRYLDAFGRTFRFVSVPAVFDGVFWISVIR